MNDQSRLHVIASSSFPGLFQDLGTGEIVSSFPEPAYGDSPARQTSVIGGVRILSVPSHLSGHQPDPQHPSVSVVGTPDVKSLVSLNAEVARLAQLLGEPTGALAQKFPVEKLVAYALFLADVRQHASDCLQFYSPWHDASTNQDFWDVLAARTAGEVDSVNTVPEVSREALPRVESVSEQLSAVRSATGANLSQLAVLLGIQRGTLYAWMDPDTTPRIQARSRARLTRLRALTSTWNTLCPLPMGKWIEETIVTPDNRPISLFAILANDQLDDSKTEMTIRQAMEQIAGKVMEADERRREKSIAERLRRRGFQPPPENTGPLARLHRGSVHLPDNPTDDD